MPDLHIPEAWQQVNLSSWTGPVLILGDTDSGKSTAIQIFYEALSQAGRAVAVVDGDPGQSTLGPPTTLTAAGPDSNQTLLPETPMYHSFVGAPSPRGHMLEVLVGAQRLVAATEAAGADVVLYDTTGFIDVRHGGRALKLALLDLLQPTTIVALQREEELEPLLTPLRQRSRCRLIDLPVSPAVDERSVAQRRLHRRERFATHFDTSSLLTIDWPTVAVVPNLDFTENQLVAFETDTGFTTALGRIEAIDRETCTLTVETPLDRLTTIDTIRLGDVCLDPETYEDQRC